MGEVSIYWDKRHTAEKETIRERGCVYFLFFILPLLLKSGRFKRTAICKVNHSPV